MNKTTCYLLSALCLLSFTGCGEFHAPTPLEIITDPFGGQSPFPRGTSKQAILADWGSPDRVVALGVDELGNLKEKWIYVGRLPAIPVDYGYVSHTKHLFFEGESLVRWETTEVGSPAKETAPSS